MITFIISVVLLLLGYFVYSKIIEKILGVDPAKATPATTMADGVDYVPMKTWRIFLIQFLNIAGVGPIVGAILGANMRHVKIITILAILFVVNTKTIAQTTDRQLVDKIVQINDIPYVGNFGDSLYWKIVAEGLDIVPNLIELIDDTTTTKATIPNWGGYYCVGDIAFRMINDIIFQIPILNFIQTKTDYVGEKIYFEFVQYDFQNMVHLKNELSKWFVANKDSLEWVNNKKEFLANHYNPPYIKGNYVFNK